MDRGWTWVSVSSAVMGMVSQGELMHAWFGLGLRTLYGHSARDDATYACDVCACRCVCVAPMEYVLLCRLC